MGNLIAEAYHVNLKNHVSGKLIDLGCGKVPLYETYQPFATDVFCTDRGGQNEMGMYLDFISDLSFPLPIKGEVIDTIILSDVLEHIPQPDMLWGEMARILRTGGVIFLSVPFLYGQHERPDDYYRYTKFALERFAKQSGFNILLLQPLGGSLEVLADIAAKHIQNIPLIGKLVAVILQEITFMFSRTKIGIRTIEKTGEFFPLGHFVVAEKLPKIQHTIQ